MPEDNVTASPGLLSSGTLVDFYMKGTKISTSHKTGKGYHESLCAKHRGCHTWAVHRQKADNQTYGGMVCEGSVQTRPGTRMHAGVQAEGKFATGQAKVSAGVGYSWSQEGRGITAAAGASLLPGGRGPEPCAVGAGLQAGMHNREGGVV